MEDRRQWNATFKVLRENICQSRILYLKKIFFKNGSVKDLKKKNRRENLSPEDSH